MRDLATRLKDALDGRYSIKREVGRGGMATVFLARDLRHDRNVALKVLHPAIASGIGSKRFEQEIRLAARLQHPHVVPVHDSGAAPDLEGEPDLLWFTMPFVSGESLRERLRREGQLPVADAVRIARQVADALDHAHREGVIHRDIKPENILLTGNHALVTDFGVAVAASSGAGAPVDTLTATGTAIGTITYMSPEQSTAQRDLDGRTDQYSVACVLYEMLVGEPPFTGATGQIVMSRRLTEDPRPVRMTRPGVPPALEQAISTALSRVPADRFPSMADFASALEKATTPEPVSRSTGRTPPRLGVVVGVIATLALLALGIRYVVTPEKVSAADAPMRLAVLPFQLVGDSADLYLALGMALELSGKLSNVKAFEVIADASISEYRNNDKPLDQIAAELRVRYLLTGTLAWQRTDTPHVAIVRPRLVEVTPGGAIVNRWGETFNSHFTDVFEVQSEIASRIAVALQVAVTPETRAKLEQQPTRNTPAYDEFMRGEAAYIGASGPASQIAALNRYRNAVALDTTFARAWARLAQVSASIYTRDLRPVSASTARMAAQKALAIDARLPEAHLAMGNVLTLVDGDYEGAIRAYRAGLALDAKHAELLGAMGFATQGLGRFDEAIDYMQRGLRLDPRSLLFTRRLTRALTWARRYKEAEEVSRQALALKPDDNSALQYAVLLRLAQGDLAGAKSIVRSIPSTTDLPELLGYWAVNIPISAWFLDEDQKGVITRLPASAFGDSAARLNTLIILAFRRGDTVQARAYADSLGRMHGYRAQGNERFARITYGYWGSLLGRRDAVAIAEGEATENANDPLLGPQMRHDLVQISLMAGDHDSALRHLEVLVGMPYYVTPAWLQIDPSFDLIRDHPRFKRLLAVRPR